MNKRTVCGVILCVFLLSLVFCAGSCGDGKATRGNGGSNIRYRTEEEFLQNIEGRSLGLTPADFVGVDVDGFVDYSHLLTGTRASFNEEDIPEITSIFMSTIMMMGPCEKSFPVCYLIDFEENTLMVPSDGENYAPSSLYALGSVHPDRLPDDALKIIGEFMVASDIMTPGKGDFPGTRWFILCIGFKDGSVVRYPVEKTPQHIYLFLDDLYGYINRVGQIKNCWGCELCPVMSADGTAR